MDLYSSLKQAGLTKSETTIYLYLLENGLSTPPMIAKGTGIARTNCYNILESLEVDGVIEEQMVGKRKAYLASDPAAILRTLEKKKEAIERVIPDLRGLYITQKNKPKIRFYEGVEQVQEIYRASLEAKKITAIGSTKQISGVMGGFLSEYFVEIKNRGIIFRDILTKNSEAIAASTKLDLKAFYDFKLLPSSLQDPPTDILLWDNSLALITLEEPIFGTVLVSPPLAKTFSMLADLIWDKV